MHIPEKYKFVFSKGTPWVEKILAKYSKNLPKSEAFKVTKNFYREIQKVNAAVDSVGIPSNLQLCFVNNLVNTGVFLKPESKPIRKGTFIGIYTGIYELVPFDLSSHNSYSYDVAQEIRLKKEDLSHVTRHDRPLDVKEDYSIQTNAMEAGNFTRFINHSSSEPNIEAVVAKFPDGRIEVILFALHTIRPGEQLLSNYGGQYWKALNIIPNDMTPNTYELSSSHQLKLTHPAPSFSEKSKEFLLPLRNPSIEVSEKFKSLSIYKKCKKAVPPLLEKYKDKIEEAENVILERGLLRNLSLVSYKDRWRIVAGDTSIAKGSLLGLLSGTLSCLENSHCIEIAKTTKTHLFLDLTQEGNCFSHLRTDPLENNATSHLMYDQETDTFYFLILAKRKIKPKEPIVLSPFEVILL